MAWYHKILNENFQNFVDHFLGFSKAQLIEVGFEEAKEYVTFTSFEANSKHDCFNECIRNINCSLVQFRNEYQNSNYSLNCLLKRNVVNETNIELDSFMPNSEFMKIARKSKFKIIISNFELNKIFFESIRK